MIQTFLQRAVVENAAYVEGDGQPMPAEPIDKGIPTLAIDVYQKLTPMLQARFDEFGA